MWNITSSGDNKFLTFPWEDGTRIDQIIKYYNDLGFKDWEYPETGIPDAEGPASRI